MIQEETDFIQPGQSYPIWSPYKSCPVEGASSNWLENVIGSVSDEQTFLEALEYGKSLRYADRPTEETKE
ncbi:MAG: hypothetical protein AB4352_14050 [Hormoscilla sp.]